MLGDDNRGSRMWWERTWGCLSKSDRDAQHVGFYHRYTPCIKFYPLISYIQTSISTTAPPSRLAIHARPPLPRKSRRANPIRQHARSSPSQRTWSKLATPIAQHHTTQKILHTPPPRKQPLTILTTAQNGRHRNGHRSPGAGPLRPQSHRRAHLGRRNRRPFHRGLDRHRHECA